ncbi:CIC11C00000003918 [Sungouiella intermedia]|uniref:CIC11C00000003918 n=1 Tax=Sungouiella intermedia TaxID=45354 RepID=A0A1L0D919_9ASCO|nr:CIC11C00000003918 [[Candida] intermedia]SGZ58665.1 CIC11C00000005192 [[Candida] intermedia]
MAPAPTTQESTETEFAETLQKLTQLQVIGGGEYKKKVKTGTAASWLERLPAPARKRLEKYNIDLSKGYPKVPESKDIPKFVDEAFEIRNEEFPYIERGKNADPEKKALFGAAKEVRNLTKHIGTEIIGLQLSDLNDQQKDELALLIAERVVVFFRNQDLSPQKQLELGKYWGQVEVHAQVPRVPDGADGEKLAGISVIWQDYAREFFGLPLTFKNSIGGNSQWHTDLVHEFQPAGITHLHNDTIPEVGGDTVWASGYAAYDKLSPALQEFLDGKTAIYRSAHQYLDRDRPFNGLKWIEREHPIVRTHPATGWKFLFVNRAMTVRIVGLQPNESKLILDYLFSLYEKNLDIQVRWNWRSEEGLGTSAIWDNRVSQHNAIWDHEGLEPRHGTRVTSLAEVPFFDPESKSQRQALGLSLD